MKTKSLWTISKLRAAHGDWEYWTTIGKHVFGPFADKGAAILDLMERLNDAQRQVADAAFDILRKEDV